MLRRGNRLQGAVGPADCVIVKADGTEQAAAPKGFSEEGVWGVQAPGISMEEVSGLGEKGSDFLVLDAENSPGALLNEENVTKVLCVSTLHRRGVPAHPGGCADRLRADRA